MTTTNHTPEPWYLDRGQIRDKDGDSLASVPYSLGSRDHANGVLMAAAPELLSALQWFADELPGIIRANCPYGVPLSVSQAHDRAVAVIAKAEGK